MTGVNGVGPDPSALTDRCGNGGGKGRVGVAGWAAVAVELVVIAAVLVVAGVWSDRLVEAPPPFVPPQPKSNAAAAAASVARAAVLAGLVRTPLPRRVRKPRAVLHHRFDRRELRRGVPA
jgi:hypothetical protein